MLNQQPETPIEDKTPVQVQGEIERELFGKWTIMLRNIGGILAIITMCVTSILNGYTTHLSVSDKGIWPSETTIFITNIGLVIVAWTWVNANKTIATIFQATDLTDRWRNRVANVISTDKKEPQAPNSDEQRNS